MAAVDLSLLGRDLPDLGRYRAALSRSSVALSSEFNLPTDRQQLAAQGPYRADQRQRFQRPFSAAQRDLDVDAAVELGRLNLRPFSSASTREVIAEAQRIVDKYKDRTLSGRWPTDGDTRRSLESARRVAPQMQPTPPPPPHSMRKYSDAPDDLEEDVFDESPSSAGYRYGRPHQHPLRSAGALFATDPRRRSLATPLPSQQQRWRSHTEVEARREAMRILREVGLADAYKSQAEVQEAQQQQQQQQQEQQQQHKPPQHHRAQPQPPQQQQPPVPPPSSTVPLPLEEFASGVRPLRTPLASSGYASYEDFQAKTGPSWRHPLPSHVGAGYCDEDTRRKVWDWLTTPNQLNRHDYLMKLCD